MQAKDIMTKEVISTRPETTLDEVARILTENNISGLPVVDEDNRLVGIITEGDLLMKDSKVKFPSYINILGGIIYLDSTAQYIEELKKTVAQKVEELMTEDVIMVNEAANNEEMATLMVEHNINRLPVVRDGKLVGIVSRADIIKSWAVKPSL